MIDQKLMFPFFLKDIKRHTFKIGRHGFQNLWSRKFEWCEIRGWGEGLNQGRGNQEPVSRKPQKLFGPVKAIFSSSASENGLVYMPETSCMKRTMTVYSNNLWIKQLCNCKVQDFAVALRAQKVSGAFEKQAPGKHGKFCTIVWYFT